MGTRRHVTAGVAGATFARLMFATLLAFSFATSTASKLSAQLPVQSTPPAAPDSAFQRAVRDAVRHGWMIRIYSFQDSIVVGRATEATSTTLSLVGARVPFTSIRSIEQRTTSGGGARAGALIVGVPFGLLVGTIVMQYCGRPRCELSGVAAGVFSGLIAGVVGGMIGSVVNRPDVHWKPVWSAN